MRRVAGQRLPRRGAPTRILRNLICLTLPACLVTGAAFALGLEVWLRLTWDPRRGTPGMFIADPVRKERLAPGYEGWFAQAPVRINNLGFRDPDDFSVDAGQEDFRILLLGDSVTFGHGIPFEDTYPHLLELRLREWAPGRAWQVWNLGVPGYNTSQELAYLLEVGPLYRPDLVVVGFYDNDVLENVASSPPSSMSRLKATVKGLLKRSLFSYDWYKKAYLSLSHTLFTSAEAKTILESLAREELLLRRPTGAGATRRKNALEVAARDASCETPEGPPLLTQLLATAGLQAWKDAVAGLRELEASEGYQVVFFLNAAPEVCPGRDLFDDRRTRRLDRYLLEEMGGPQSAVSAHDAFLRYRPSAVPLARGHSQRSANAVKAAVLFEFLRDGALGGLGPPAGGEGDSHEHPDELQVHQGHVQTIEKDAEQRVAR